MPFDVYERPVQYLRVSVTDRCNLRCLYCMPEEGVVQCSHQDILRHEEIVRIVRIAVETGFMHIRLTGGEPLVRRGIVDLVAELARIPGLDDLSMTTNGILLRQYAKALARAGLRRINLSLDTLRPERFRQITRWGNLEDVLAGREAALAAGLRPIKINMVVIRGLNDDEVVDMARKTIEPDWHVRFIEVMPLGAGVRWFGDGVVPAAEIRARIEEAVGPLTPVHGEVGIGPARYYRLPGAAGTVGFIGAVTEHFCHFCNRLRLTSDGRLLPCLLSSATIDLRTPLRNGATDEELRALFMQAVVAKPRGHALRAGWLPSAFPISHIGG
ncbi:MAG: GTP 3',8-cyclase MoaA [Anaerolineae bacterium]|nr:GTP 3',8-cyclase MoaA [Anaerolineae bacterium]MDW8069220.1 GTP 3',8-cyclase MoaA [Anaerolineae bacterium]